MLHERLGGGCGEFAGGAAGGVGLQDQGLGLAGHGLLDKRQLSQLLTGEDAAQPLGPRVDVALSASLT
jgi:hypothetical protein